MFNKVVKYLQNELISFLGASDQTEVDHVLNHLPDGTVTGNKTICVLRRRAAPLNYEIGRKGTPTNYTFTVDVMLIVSTSTDRETCIDDLQRLERKVWDLLGRTSTLNSFSETEDNQTYRVIDYLIRGIDYPESIAQFDKATQVSIIQLDIRIQQIINA